MGWERLLENENARPRELEPGVVRPAEYWTFRSLLLRKSRNCFGLLGPSGSEDAKFHSSSSLLAAAGADGAFDGPARAAKGSAAGAGAAVGGEKAFWEG